MVSLEGCFGQIPFTFLLIEKKLSKEERRELRKNIEKKYNPSTIFRTYPGGMDFAPEK